MPVRYVPYDVEPVSGQAVLNNFNRLLKYKGSGDVGVRIQRGMPYYEAIKIETVGDEGGRNMVFRGDCLSTCAYLKDNGIKVDLVYIDPPFMSGADYAKKIYLRRNPKLAEEAKKTEEQIESDSEFREFEEKMYGDIWDKEKYLNWMYENLMAIRSVMSENASIYVHLDYHIGHYVKILMDEIFGEDCFQNEIIWKRTTSRAGSSFYNHIHDTIFFYALSEDAVWNQQYSEYTSDYLDTMFDHYDSDGRRWRASPLTAPGISTGPSGETWRGINPGLVGKGRHWAIPGYLKESLSEEAKKDTIRALDELDAMGRIVWAKGGKGSPSIKQYIDDVGGVELQSIWTDIGVSSGNYATEKPEQLLERIILSSSDEGMIVADFFGGSGVTAAVSSKLGRNFITSDIGLNSVQTMRDRLIKNSVSFSIYEVKDGVSLFRNPAQTMDKLKSMITGLRNEDGLDKFWAGAIHDPRRGIVPVYIPNLMDSTNRILDEVLLRRIIYEAIPDLDPGIKNVIVYYIDTDNLDKLKSFAEECADLSVSIEFRDLKEVLDDFTVEDDLEFTVSEDRERLGGYVVTLDRFSSDAVAHRIQTFNVKSARNDKKGTFKPIALSEDGLEMIEMVSLDCTASEDEWHSDSEVMVDKFGYIAVDGRKTDKLWDGRIRSDSRPLRVKVRNICGDETIFKVDNLGSGGRE